MPDVLAFHVGTVVYHAVVVGEVDPFEGQVAHQSVEQLLVMVLGQGEVGAVQERADQPQGFVGDEDLLQNRSGEYSVGLTREISLLE